MAYSKNLIFYGGVFIYSEKALVSEVMRRFGHEVFTPGLERTKPLYAFFVAWIEKNKIPVVTIAGTNGKGESAYSLEWLLHREGYSSALWTSPHIVSLTERFSFDQMPIHLEHLGKEVEESFLEIEKLSFKVSFYEFLFLVFLKLSYGHYHSLSDEQKKKFVLLLEVGLGGRLDAVNHFSANMVCLTSISRDHREILGNTYLEILGEKCGVLRDEAILVSSLELQYLREELAEIVNGYRGILHEELFQVGQLHRNSDFSTRNRTLAFRSFELLLEKFFKVKPVNSLTESLREWPNFKGRSEVFYQKDKKIIFIGAHNVDGMRKLAERYQQKSKRSFIFLSSFSKRDTREVEHMLSMLSHLGEKIVVTGFEHPKAFDVETLKILAQKFHQVTFKNSWKNFLKEFNEQDEIKEITITGSYYFIGEVQRYLEDGDL